MAFSFGAPAAQPAQTSGGLFGNNNAQASSSTNTGFGFGNNANNQQQQGAQTGGGLFGAQQNSQPAAGGGLFGGSKPAGLSLNTSQPAAGGGLFGAAPAAGHTQAGGGLFGSTNASTSNTGGLFGQQQSQQPAAGGGLFGQQQTQNQSQNQPAAGGLFGQQQQQPVVGGLFSQQQQQPAAGGLFGQQQQQPAAGGGLFGQQNNQSTGGGLFGQQQQNTQPAAGGLFGSTTNQPGAGGLFGATNNAAKPGGLFGSTAQPSGGLFGSTAQQPAGGLFGSTAQQPGQQSLLGSTANPLAASTAPQEPSMEERMTIIQRSWDTNAPECKFKYFFYNMVEPGTTGQYGRPAGATDDAKWARAVRDTPDPTSMVPVLATGWNDIQKRVQMQEQTASVHQQRVKELNQALANLSRQTALSSSVRLASLQQHLQQLTQRLMHLAAVSPSFAPVQSSAFRPEEGEMKHTLETVKDALDGRTRAHTNRSGSVGMVVSAPRSQNKGRMLGQINELWGGVEEVRRQRRARGDTSWAGDERMLSEIALILDQQQTALTKLSMLANDAVFDADVIRQGLAPESRK